MTKADLQKYRGLMIEQMRLKNRIEELAVQITRATPSYSITPRGGKSADNVDRIIKLAELKKEYAAESNRIAAERVRIEKTIEKLADPTERTILKYRYIDNMRWEDISKIINYGRSRTFDKHKTAIRNFEKIKSSD